MEENIINFNDYKITSRQKEIKNLSPSNKQNILYKPKGLNKLTEKLFQRNIKKISLSLLNRHQKYESSTDKYKDISLDEIIIKNKRKEKDFLESSFINGRNTKENDDVCFKGESQKKKFKTNSSLTPYTIKRKNILENYNLNNNGIIDNSRNKDESKEKKNKLYENQRDSFFKKYMSKIRENVAVYESSGTNLSIKLDNKNTNFNLTSRENSKSKEKIRDLIENINHKNKCIREKNDNIVYSKKNIEKRLKEKINNNNFNKNEKFNLNTIISENKKENSSIINSQNNKLKMEKYKVIESYKDNEKLIYNFDDKKELKNEKQNITNSNKSAINIKHKNNINNHSHFYQYENKKNEIENENKMDIDNLYNKMENYKFKKEKNEIARNRYNLKKKYDTNNNNFQIDRNKINLIFNNELLKQNLSKDKMLKKNYSKSINKSVKKNNSVEVRKKKINIPQINLISNNNYANNQEENIYCDTSPVKANNFVYNTENNNLAKKLNMSSKTRKTTKLYLNQKVKDNYNIERNNNEGVICLLCNKNCKKPLMCPKCRKICCEQCIKNKKKKNKFCSFCNYYINDITKYLIFSKKKLTQKNFIKNLEKNTLNRVSSLDKRQITKSKYLKNKNKSYININTETKRKNSSENKIEEQIIYNKNILENGQNVIIYNDKKYPNKFNDINNNEILFSPEISISNSLKNQNDLRIEPKKYENVDTEEEIYSNKVEEKKSNGSKKGEVEVEINIKSLKQRVMKMKNRDSINDDKSEDTIRTIYSNSQEQNFYDYNVRKRDSNIFNSDLDESNIDNYNRGVVVEKNTIMRKNLSIREYDNKIKSNNEEKKLIQNMVNNKDFCLNHSSRELKYYCIQCDKEYCEICYENHFDNHNIIHYSNINYIEFKKLLLIKNFNKEKGNLLQNNLDNCEQNIKSYNSEKNLIIKEFNKIMNNYINDIELKIEEIKTIVEDIKKKQETIKNNNSLINQYLELYYKLNNEKKNIKLNDYEEFIKNNYSINNMDNLLEKQKINNKKNYLILNYFSSQLIDNISLNNNNNILFVSKLNFNIDNFNNFINDTYSQLQIPITNNIVNKIDDDYSNLIELENFLFNNYSYEKNIDYNFFSIKKWKDKALFQVNIFLDKNIDDLKENEDLCDIINVNCYLFVFNSKMNNYYELKQKKLSKGRLCLYEFIALKELDSLISKDLFFRIILLNHKK